MANASYPSVLGASIQTAEIDALAVTTAKIAAKAVTIAKMADGTADKLLGFDSLGVVAELARAPLVLLSDRTAAEAEATYTYTPSAALTTTDYSKIIVIISGSITALLNLLLRINGISTATYRSIGFRVADGSLVAISSTGATSMQLASSTLLNGTPEIFYMTIEILLSGSRLAIFSRANDENTICEMMSHNQDVETTITSLEFLTSTSTWASGTRFQVYGVKRS